jgi:hypothetical protein
MPQQLKADQGMAAEFDLSNKRLAHLESVIKKYRQDFYSVGKALTEIRDGRYYLKLSFKSFESYVKLRWDMGRSHAYRLIEAAGVIDNLSPIGDVLPKNEAQARALSRLDLFSQKKVWRNFLKTQKPLSALNINKFVSAYLGEQNTSTAFCEIISKDYQQAVREMLSQITMAQNDRWKSTSQTTALYWNKVMKEKIQWG